jgi:hypothetical protein
MLKKTSLLAALALLSPAALAASSCVPGPGDVPETTLQGGLTVEKRNVAGGFQGEQCGLRQVGHNALLNEQGRPRGSFGDIQLFGLCAYASMRDPSTLTLASTGTAVVDMRVPSNPVWTHTMPGRTLRTLAMQRAYSALEIQKSIMIAAFKDFGPNGNNWFDIYDVSADCLNPTPLAVNTDPAQTRKFTTSGGNHDGWLTPDAKTYYGIPFGGVRILSGPAGAPVLNNTRIDMHVLDMSDPRNPQHLLNWNRLELPQEVWPRVLATTNFHDISSNDDGTRVYLALYGGNNSLGGNNNNPIPEQNQRCSNGLLVLDSSEVQKRLPNPKLHYVSFFSWCDDQTTDPDFGDGSTASSHATEYVIHEDGTPYILSTDESSAGLDGEWNVHVRQRTFSRLIDISDERNPRLVSTFKPDVNDPDNATPVMQQQINGGMLHYIGFDDRYKMRLVFYAGANQGIRVVDFRDARNPKEIAYYKAPSVVTTQQGENDFTRPDPRYDQDNCLLYTGWNQGGLRVLELTSPQYNACMRRAVNGGGFLAGTRTNIGFDVGRADEGLGALQGSLSLNDRGAGVKISIEQVSYLSAVRDECGAILPSASAVQFNGSGTFNGAPASFRVCVQDGGEGKKASGPDRFFLTCTAGCSYSANATLGNGNIDVRQR